MEGMVGAAGELAIDGDEVLHLRHLGRNDDAVGSQPELDGALRRGHA